MSSPRRLALDILLKVESEQSYSNIAIDAALAKSGLGERDAAFVTALTYGVLETRLRLDWLLKGCLSGSINKLKPKVLEILRLGAYQMVYMDKIPPRSAVDESVKLTKSKRLRVGVGTGERRAEEAFFRTRQSAGARYGFRPRRRPRDRVFVPPCAY
jgi:16S rRNA (cytosine967-C5)-methyltransferase